MYSRCYIRTVKPLFYLCDGAYLPRLLPGMWCSTYVGSRIQAVNLSFFSRYGSDLMEFDRKWRICDQISSDKLGTVRLSTRAA